MGTIVKQHYFPRNDTVGLLTNIFVNHGLLYSAESIGQLFCVKERLKVAMYHEILSVLPSVTALKIKNSWVLQHDNVLMLTAKKFKEQLTRFYHKHLVSVIDNNSNITR